MDPSSSAHTVWAGALATALPPAAYIAPDPAAAATLFDARTFAAAALSPLQVQQLHDRGKHTEAGRAHRRMFGYRAAHFDHALDEAIRIVGEQNSLYQKR